MKKIIDFLFSKKTAYIFQLLMMLGIILIVFFKEEITNEDILNTIFFCFIFLVEEIKLGTGYYEKK